VEPVVSFDVDSFLGFASSLAVTRQVLRHQPAPLARQNQQMDVDIDTTVYAAAEDPEAALRSRTAMRKDMPHCYLGRVEGASEISLYVLFPHLTTAHGDFTILIANQHSRWLDQGFILLFATTSVLIIPNICQEVTTIPWPIVKPARSRVR
jgi:hypothetical protein